MVKTEKFLYTSYIDGYKPIGKVVVKEILGFYNETKNILLAQDEDGNVYKLLVDEELSVFHCMDQLVYADKGSVYKIARYRNTHVDENRKEENCIRYLFPLYSTADMLAQDRHLLATIRGMHKAVQNKAKDSTKNRNALESMISKYKNMGYTSGVVLEQLAIGEMYL